MAKARDQIDRLMTKQHRTRGVSIFGQKRLTPEFQPVLSTPRLRRRPNVAAKRGGF